MQRTLIYYKPGQSELAKKLQDIKQAIKAQEKGVDGKIVVVMD